MSDTFSVRITETVTPALRAITAEAQRTRSVLDGLDGVELGRLAGDAGRSVVDRVGANGAGNGAHDGAGEVTSRIRAQDEASSVIAAALVEMARAQGSIKGAGGP